MACEGSKVPVEVLKAGVAGDILHVPPGVLGDNVNAGSVGQTGGGGQKLGSQHTGVYWLQALMLTDSIFPLRLVAELLLCAPPAITSPLLFTSTSYTVKETEDWDKIAKFWSNFTTLFPAPAYTFPQSSTSQPLLLTTMSPKLVELFPPGIAAELIKAPVLISH